MTREHDAANGVELAQRALRRYADGLDAEALAVINAGTEAEAKWAAAYLLSAVRECVEARFDKPAQVRAFIHQASRDPGDALLTRVGVMLHEGERGGDHR